jgi:microsomal dipeptidase-like Zn-dependent dipeptidase
MSLTTENVRKIIEDIVYFDIHGHKEKLLPPVLRLLSPGRIPRDVKLSQLKGTGVNGFIVCAIGDPNSFKKNKTDPFKYVIKQLNNIKKTIARAGGVIAATADELEKGIADGKKTFVLGIEGGDFIAEDLTRLSFVYDEGVRVLIPMHYSKNLIGSISFGWRGRIVPVEEQTGLTQFGKELIGYANNLGMIIDLAHADEKTIADVVKITARPVMCSHTGPRSLQDFPRYISDDALKAIAETGGLIGLWPFLYRGKGMKDLDSFVQFSGYIADLIGVEHLALGTDINGVPGNMKGYENLNDAFILIKTLSERGFNEEELKMIAGGNFLNFFRNTKI